MRGRSPPPCDEESRIAASTPQKWREAFDNDLAISSEGVMCSRLSRLTLGPLALPLERPIRARTATCLSLARNTSNSKAGERQSCATDEVMNCSDSSVHFS